MSNAIRSFNHLENFKWDVYQGRSYSEIDRGLNKQKVLYKKLRIIVAAPKYMLIGALVFTALAAIKIAITLSTGDVTALFLKPRMILLITCGGVLFTTAIIASMLLIYVHHNKLSQRDIENMKAEFKTELKSECERTQDAAKALEKLISSHPEFMEEFPQEN